jgi:hypothetical protein
MSLGMITISIEDLERDLYDFDSMAKGQYKALELCQPTTVYDRIRFIIERMQKRQRDNGTDLKQQ